MYGSGFSFRHYLLSAYSRPLINQKLVLPKETHSILYLHFHHTKSCNCALVFGCSFCSCHLLYVRHRAAPPGGRRQAGRASPEIND
jgi:hypothetical protein